MRKSLTANWKRGQMLRKLAKQFELVYFGSVSQHHDEHDVIKGLTISTTHTDRHYMVGDYSGYDVAIVDRYDKIKSPSSKLSVGWIIIRITLDSQIRMPHTLYLARGADDIGLGQLVGLSRHLMKSPQHEQNEFSNRYDVYSTNADETPISATVLRVIAARAWPNSIELQQNNMYVYISDTHPSMTLVKSTIQTAVAIAEAIESEQGV